MMAFREVLTAFDIGSGELTMWIGQQWVKPLRQADEWYFDEADLARVQLICELRREFEVGEEALPLVLSLLDQLYATRATLAHLREVIADLPEPTAAELLAALKRELE